MADDPPPTPSAEEIAASVTERVREILAAAEEAAERIRRTVDQETAIRAQEIRMAAERDAERLVQRAEREAQAYLEDAIRRVDAFAHGRLRRIQRVGDRLLAHAETLELRADRATGLHEGIDELVAALARAAEAIAAEAGRAPIVLPSATERPAEVTRLTAVEEPEEEAGESEPLTAVDEPAPEDHRATDEHARPPLRSVSLDEATEAVRRIASELPRRPGPRAVPPPEPPGPPEPPEPPPDDAA